MTWDRPWALISALLLGVIVVLHLITRRRLTVRVPSLLLWDRLFEEEKRALTLRRLTTYLLLFLQLLAAANLVLSAAGIRVGRGDSHIGVPTVLLMDVSASMAASDSEGRRFDLARSKALDRIRRKPPRGEMMILAAGSAPQIVVPFTASRTRLRAAMRELEPRAVPGRPKEALRAAISMAAGRGGRTVFFTDGAFEDPGMWTGNAEAVIVGTSVPNRAVTGLAVRATPGGGREILVTAENFSEIEAVSNLSVSVDGDILMDEPLFLPSGGRKTRTVFWSGGPGGRATVTLSNGGALSDDDQAYAVLVPGGTVRVRLLTPGNWFLETALKTHPHVRVSVNDANIGGYEDFADIVVADRRFPPDDPGGPLFIVYPQENAIPLALEPGGFTGELRPTSWDREHPVTRGIDFSRLSVDRATELSLPPDAEVLVRADTFPLIVAGDSGGRRWVALSFDLLESSLPLRAAFPLLIHRVVAWLSPADPEQAAFVVKTGDDWVLPAEFRNREWSLWGPGGADRGIPPSASPTVPDIDRTGFWMARTDEAEMVTGVSLLDAGESEIRPRWTPPAATDSAVKGPGGNEEAPRRGGWTAVLAAAALTLLFIEWILQTRYWRSA